LYRSHGAADAVRTWQTSRLIFEGWYSRFGFIIALFDTTSPIQAGRAQGRDSRAKFAVAPLRAPLASELLRIILELAWGALVARCDRGDCDTGVDWFAINIDFGNSP
jgi:hypothetical protein